MSRFFVVFLLLVGVSSQIFAISAEDLIVRMDELYRMESSQASMRMTIETPDWQRTLMMDTWSLGMDYTLVRITSPKKDAGIATLKRDNQMWNYFPKVRRIIKVPPSMMMGSWMGSDFTNDDLVREDSLAEDYRVSLLEEEQEYMLTLIPEEKTVTVWGKIQIWIDKERLLPTKQTFFDEQSNPVREMHFSNIRKFDDKWIPAKLELTPLTKENHKTIVEYTDLTFNIDLNERFFSLQELKR
ncbi:outer membrane lipoprotein-sorting protein [Bermanella sp. R86510]|uniref:outer membrane lipoprotein-sorting protein n=1 Tax=unclassified Bermanella TaxID=2627862 RepID=UPI0037CA55CD